MKTKRTIFLFTENFPYGSAESFLENEIQFASKFATVYIFPRSAYNKETPVRPVPDNVKVVNLVPNEKSLSQKRGFFRHLIFNLRVLALEIFKSGKPMAVVSRARELVSILNKAHSLSNLVESFRLSNKIVDPVYYSYWMNEWTLALSISRDKSILNKFCFRVLGYDIYDERHPRNYLPFRYYNYSRTNRVYAVSKNSMNYIKAKNIFPQKITYSYLGTTDHGLNPPSRGEVFTILSCSRLILLKRVSLIPEILKNIDRPVNWIHIGSGPELGTIEKRITELKPNIQVKLIPHFERYSGLIDFYLNNHVDLFLHVSESEGLGVVQLEAMSFGIPVFSTKVGGATEFINERTGNLLDIDFKPADAAKMITHFMDNQTTASQFRLNARKYWKENFEDVLIYNQFYSELLN
jgi:glycosyltransferase involved in cell wall biosynthesis